MAEMVYRPRRRRRVRMLDEKRFAIPVPTKAQLIALAKGAAQATPAFLLTLCELMEMPAGLYAAYIASLAALHMPMRWPLAGAGAAMLLQWASGMNPGWAGPLTLLLLVSGPWLLPGRGNLALLLFTAGSLLPMAVAGWLAPTALETLLALGSLAFSTLCAPVICRGLKALTARSSDGQLRHMDTMEDRLGAGALALMVVCGGARLLLAGMNMGMMGASALVMLLAMQFGAGAGCAAGILSGICLSLTGLPMLLSVALAAGGFLAGTMQATGRRCLCCGSYAAVALLVMLLGGVAGVGCGAAAADTAGVICLLPARTSEALARQVIRLRMNAPQAADAYAASMLASWEKTVDAMAMSVPMPVSRPPVRDGAWWTARLCEGCEEAEGCGCFRSQAAVERAESVWDYREADEPRWQGAMEELRWIGCQRLYQLRHAMESLRQEEAVRERHIRRAMEQRSMLVTHLTAMAGAARRFAHLSQGENWWDAVTSRRIRAALSDAAAPVQLLWLRRVNDHVQAAFLLEDITSARRQAEELCELVSAATGVGMMTVSIDNGRIRLAQKPPLEAECGVGFVGADGQSVCGDTAWHGLLQDGRFMAALSDGMGHGEEAALSSQQTVELLRLCLDAGYTLQQTLTAVNGMMLLGGSGERFITVDLLTIDLWTGQALLEKLGAAGSWLHQRDELLPLTGDALPLGILESIDAGEKALRLQPGDALILMTDGVEEAFPDRDALQDAILLALTEENPAHAADSLLQAAYRAEDGVRRDDQTVLVLRLREAGKRNGTVE